jgi:hypothetical protein
MAIASPTFQSPMQNHLRSLDNVSCGLRCWQEIAVVEGAQLAAVRDWPYKWPPHSRSSSHHNGFRLHLAAQRHHPKQLQPPNPNPTSSRASSLPLPCALLDLSHPCSAPNGYEDTDHSSDFDLPDTQAAFVGQRSD